MTLAERVVDAFSPYSHKKALDNPGSLVSSWVPRTELRRLASYRLLAAYLENVARDHLRTADAEDRRAHREYGDPALLVERVVAGVLGDEVTIGVDGADADLPEQPIIPDAPQEPGDDASDIERAAFDAQQRVWDQRARQAIDEWEAAWSEQPALQERQEWLREWADRELFDQRLWECEHGAVGMGDGVYVLAWSTRQQRPVVRVYDAGFYFPVLDDEAYSTGFPTTVHLAFETDEDGDGTLDHVRRITWRLGRVLPELVDDGRGRLVPATRRALGDISWLEAASIDDEVALREGDRRLADGTIVRRYPWQPDEDSTVTCYMTDAMWPLRDLRGQPVATFPDDRAVFAINEDGTLLRNLDLRIDFLPVVHVPNTPATQEHFGKSVLARVMQLLDDIASSDSDLQDAAALAGTPMVSLAGASLPKLATDRDGRPVAAALQTPGIEVRPGVVVSLPEGGRMDALDLSHNVEALRHVVDDLLDRFSVNSQVAAAVLGRVKPSEVSSGVELALHFGPFRSLVSVLRLVRDQKYRLFFKLVQRLAQAGGALPPGELPTARLVFGSFLPEDRKALIDEVVALVGANLMSRATALRVLVAAGVPVEDVPDELARIASTDFEGANRLMDAVNDEDAVRAYLGVPGESPNEDEPPAPPPPPIIPLP